MLRGNKIRLRPVQESDLSQLYQFHTDVVRRGEYYPKDIVSEPAYRKSFPTDWVLGKERWNACDRQ